MVSAHICYWLEQRANSTGHGVKSRQTGGGDTGVVVNLGDLDRIWATVEVGRGFRSCLDSARWLVAG